MIMTALKRLFAGTIYERFDLLFSRVDDTRDAWPIFRRYLGKT